MHTDESNTTTHYYYINWGWGNFNGVYLSLVPNQHGYTGNRLYKACVNIKPKNQ